MSEVFKRQSWAQISGLPRTGSFDFDPKNIAWQECGADGFVIKPLMEDEQAGVRSWLMKIAAGAFSPPHAHDEIEQVYVLEGSFFDQDKTYGPGEYIVRAPGSMHSAGSENGAVVLLFYSPVMKA